MQSLLCIRQIQNRSFKGTGTVTSAVDNAVHYSIGLRDNTMGTQNICSRMAHYTGMYRTNAQKNIQKCSCASDYTVSGGKTAQVSTGIKPIQQRCNTTVCGCVSCIIATYNAGVIAGL